jgi:hypothetical protein
LFAGTSRLIGNAMQPFRMSAVALLDAYRRRALSPLEAMRASLPFDLWLTAHKS